MPVPSQPALPTSGQGSRREPVRRRALFVAAGATALISVAGCSGGDPDDGASSSAATPSRALASASEGAITITQGWVAATEPKTSGKPSASASGSATPMGPVSAAYGLVSNSTDKHDALIEVTSPVAGQCQLHLTTQQGETSTMKQINSIDIPPNGAAVFAVGGFHVMLTELKGDLAEGDTVELTWSFRSGTKITTAFPVISSVNRPS